MYLSEWQKYVLPISAILAWPPDALKRSMRRSDHSTVCRSKKLLCTNDTLNPSDRHRIEYTPDAMSCSQSVHLLYMRIDPAQTRPNPLSDNTLRQINFYLPIFRADRFPVNPSPRTLCGNCIIRTLGNLLPQKQASP